MTLAQERKVPVPYCINNEKYIYMDMFLQKGAVFIMSLLEELKDLGVDVDGGLKRINGNEKLYTKLLGSFTKAIKTYDVQPDFDADGCAEMIEKTHAIKGVSGNLSITPVYESYTKIVDLLRAGNTEDAKVIIREILPVQAKIVECIEKHMEQ